MPELGIKILIIDYEPRSIKQLSDPLTAAGYEICVAKDGITGIDTFKAEMPGLVLIEAMLPRKHGFETCQEIKQTEHGKSTPVVVVTSVYKGRKYRSQAIHQHGADEYLEKPIPTERLMETIQRLLGPSRPRSVAVPSVVPTEPRRAAEAARPSPSPGVATAVRSAESAEAEIVERLNEILGSNDGTSGPFG